MRQADGKPKGVIKMTNEERIYEEIMNQLNNTDDMELVRIWNKYVKRAGYEDDEIFMNNMDVLLETFIDIQDAIERMSFGKYDYGHAMFVMDEDLYLYSFNSIWGDYSPFDITQLCEWLSKDENYNRFYPEIDIEDLLEEIGYYDEDEE